MREQGEIGAGGGAGLYHGSLRPFDEFNFTASPFIPDLLWVCCLTFGLQMLFIMGHKESGIPGKCWCIDPPPLPPSSLPPP